MLDEEKSKPTLTKTANEGFKIIIGEPQTANLPATINVSAPAAGAGGLSYQTALPEEKAAMDKIIAGISLTNPDTIIALGSNERKELSTLADKMLDSFQPGVKIAFAEALKGLIDAVKSNSLEAIKERISKGTKSVLKAFMNAITGKDNKVEVSKKVIENFMTDISSSRKTIHEMTSKLQEQQVELDKNYTRINELGYAITVAAQRMRIVRAASAEYIRRVETGEITTLTDLQKTAETSGRADDTEKLQLAQSSWNNLRTVDGDLLGSINVYDMNVANLAFTKQANLQNRIQTATTLTTTIAEWKTQLAIFGAVTTEQLAAQLLNSAGQLTDQSIKQNQELFETLVDTITMRSAKGTYSLRNIMEAQKAMAAKLEGVGAAVEEQFATLAKDKKALEENSVHFRKSMTNVYSKKGGLLSAPPAGPTPTP